VVNALAVDFLRIVVQILLHIQHISRQPGERNRREDGVNALVQRLGRRAIAPLEIVLLLVVPAPGQCAGQTRRLGGQRLAPAAARRRKHQRGESGGAERAPHTRHARRGD